MQAFRTAFAAGQDLSIPTHVLRAVEAAGLDPGEVQGATRDPQIKLALREETSAAYELGVFGVPQWQSATSCFWGDDRLEDAAAHLQRVTAQR